MFGTSTIRSAGHCLGRSGGSAARYSGPQILAGCGSAVGGRAGCGAADRISVNCDDRFFEYSKFKEVVKGYWLGAGQCLDLFDWARGGHLLTLFEFISADAKLCDIVMTKLNEYCMRRYNVVVERQLLESRNQNNQ